MTRYDPVWTSSCGRHRRPGSAGAKCGFACYLILAVGIWAAYLWVAFSPPLTSSPTFAPAAIGRSTESSSPGDHLARQIDVTDGSGARQNGPEADVSKPGKAVVASVMRSYTPPALESHPVEPLGYSARKGLVRDIQRELIRVGCYRGAVTGRWGADTKQAMSAFLLAANARLPVNEPDLVLLSLAQGHVHIDCREKPLSNARLATTNEPNAHPNRPPGLMGIGGPKAETGEPFAKPAARAAPSIGQDIGSFRKTIRRPGDHDTRSNKPPRTIREQRTVHELMIHPLGTL